MAIPLSIRDRPTPDIIVIGLTFVVMLCVLGLAAAVIISSIWFPTHDIASLSQRIGTIISSLIGAIVGYLAGRGVNGTPPRKEPG